MVELVFFRIKIAAVDLLFIYRKFVFISSDAKERECESEMVKRDRRSVRVRIVCAVGAQI